VQKVAVLFVLGCAELFHVNANAAACLLAAWAGQCLWNARALSGPKHQPTQLTQILPRFGQKLRQSPPFRAKNALMGSVSKTLKPSTSWHKAHNWRRPPTPSPQMQGAPNLCKSCTRLILASALAILACACVLRGQRWGKGMRSDPGESPHTPLVYTA
jgi:hypothetical protein